MGILSKLISRVQGQKPESEPESGSVSEPTHPIEEKLEQSDKDRLDEQKARLAALSKKEQDALVPEGDIVK